MALTKLKATKQLDLTGFSTGNVSEGSNLYYTNDRASAAAKSALSASGDLSYNSSTGQFSVTTYKSSDFNTDFGNKSTDNLLEGSSNLWFTDARARSAISVSGDLAYVNGVISFTQRTDAQVKALITAGTGVSVANGVVSIDQSVATSASPTFAGLTVNGDIDVQGTINSINTTSTDLFIEDHTIQLNAGLTESNSPVAAGATIEVNRGNKSAVEIKWNEGANSTDPGYWSFKTEWYDNQNSQMQTSSAKFFSSNDIPQYAGVGLRFDGGENASNQYEVWATKVVHSVSGHTSGTYNISLQDSGNDIPLGGIATDHALTAVYINGMKIEVTSGASLGESDDCRFAQGAGGSSTSKLEVNGALVENGMKIEIVMMRKIAQP